MSSSDEAHRLQNPSARRLRSKRVYHSSSDDSISNPRLRSTDRIPITRSRVSSRSSSEDDGITVRRKGPEHRRVRRSAEKTSRTPERGPRKHARSSSFVFDHPMVQHARTSSYAMYQQSVGIVLKMIFFDFVDCCNEKS